MSGPIMKPGVYLDDHPPRQRQFRARRAGMRPVIVVHTAENKTDLTGGDGGAESVANFIRNRTSYGSYHLIGDTDSIIRLQTNNLTVYHDTSSNNWSTSLSGAMQAAKWATFTASRREAWIETFVTMFTIQGQDLQRRRVGLPAAKLLTRAQAHGGGSGFIGHGHMDPSRRTDPGRDFPWTEVLRRYAERVQTPYSPSTGSQSTTSNSSTTTAGLQADLNKYFGAKLDVDGAFGPATEAAVKAMQSDNGLDPDGIVGPLTRDVIAERKAAYANAKAKEITVAEAAKRLSDVLHTQRYVNSIFLREGVLDVDGNPRTVEVNGVTTVSTQRAVLDLRASLSEQAKTLLREVAVLEGMQKIVGDPQ